MRFDCDLLWKKQISFLFVHFLFAFGQRISTPPLFVFLKTKSWNVGINSGRNVHLLVQTSIDHISADDSVVIIYTWSMTYDNKELFPTAIHRNLFQLKDHQYKDGLWVAASRTLLKDGSHSNFLQDAGSQKSMLKVESFSVQDQLQIW